MAPEVGKYYDVFLEYLLAVGWHQAIVKLGVNVEDGVYPVQVVAREHGYEGANLDREIMDRNTKRWKKLDDLNYWSQRVGFKPINPNDKERVMRFMEDADRRRYIRDNIKRAAKKGELLSIADLIGKRIELERSKKLKKAQAES